MITENGTIKVSTTIDGNSQREIFHHPIILSIVFIIIGSVGIGMLIVLQILSAFVTMDEDYSYILIALSAMFLGLGIFIHLILKKAIKNADTLPTVNEYEFFKDYVSIDQILNGEKVTHLKIYNNQIVKSKESKNYIVFNVGAAMYAVAKGELTEAELNTLRLIFKLPAKGSAITLAAEIAAQTAQPAEAVQPEPAPHEPFEDFDSKE